MRQCSNQLIDSSFKDSISALNQAIEIEQSVPNSHPFGYCFLPFGVAVCVFCMKKEREMPSDIREQFDSDSDSMPTQRSIYLFIAALFCLVLYKDLTAMLNRSISRPLEWNTRP